MKVKVNGEELDGEAAARALDGIFGRHNLRLRHALYLLTHNPVFAWKAYDDAQKFGVPVPTWAVEYLSRAAARIAALQPTGKQSRESIVEALEFANAEQGALTEAREWEKRLLAYRRWRALVGDIGMSKGDAYQRIADEHGGVDTSTIARWFRAIEDAAASIPE